MNPSAYHVPFINFLRNLWSQMPPMWPFQWPKGQTPVPLTLEQLQANLDLEVVLSGATPTVVTPAYYAGYLALWNEYAAQMGLPTVKAS
jgi:hypothetical protein